MHFYARIVAVSLGLLAFSSQVHSQSSDQQGEIAGQEGLVDPLPVPIKILEDNDAVQRAKEGLSIQRGIDKTARWTAYAAWFSAFMVTIGTGFLIWTLFLTRKANGAAQDAVRVTREVAQDQARAYVHVDEVTFFWGNRFGSNPQFIFTAVNTGQTPAKWFEVVSVCKGSKIEDAAPVFSKDELAARTGCRWVSFPAGGAQTMQGNIEESDFESLQSSYGLAVGSKTDVVDSSDIVITVYGVIRYCTVFDEIFESDFFFQASKVHKYKQISRDVMGQKKDDGPASITVVSKREKPISLSKSPSEKLKVYARVSHNT